MDGSAISSNGRPDEISRPVANFIPDLWGDLFLNYTAPDEITQRQQEEEIKELKEVLRKELLADVTDLKNRLVFIDDILRLGVGYHFEPEIEANLLNFHKKQHLEDDECRKDDLHYVSLRFRLLRHHGFHESCDVFENFKCEDGSFKDCLRSDVQGLLNLYEASALRVKGENILDEALVFATTHLTSLAKQVCSPQSQQITHALKLPLNKRGIRLESTYQISFYKSKPSHHNTLLRFAILDFNLVQQLHKLELKEHTMWSRWLDSTVKLPFSMRDRVVEAFFWILGACYEPNYSQARMFLNKLFKIISIVDDLYDSYGSVEELEPFTKAIERWDKSCVNQLPEYMRSIYLVILDTFENIEQDLSREGRSYAVYYLKEQMKASCQSYIIEAKWCHKKIVPTYDMYMDNGITSSGYLYMFTSCYQGMGEIANKDAFEWLNRNTKGPRASCVIARLINDIGSHKFEQTRDHVASAIECYMGQFGSTEETTYKELLLQVEEAWKDINQDMFRPTAVPMPLLTRVINFTRALYDIYDIDEDGYTMNKLLLTKVQAVLVNPLTF